MRRVLPVASGRSRRCRGLLALWIGAWLSCSAVAGRSLSIESFEADISVRRDGTVDVTETIRPYFTGAWNGLYRTIPVEYRTPQGFNYSLLLDVVGVTDEAGRELRYESSREGHYRKLKVWIPSAVDAARTVVIRYRVRNGLKFFDEEDEHFSDRHDELYWNVTGDEWDAPIAKATASIHLPPEITGLRAQAFTGVYSSQQQAASVVLAGTDITVTTLRPLGFHEGLTVAVGWNSGAIARPGRWQKAALWIRSNGALLIPVGMLALMFWLWRTRGRDPRLRSIAPQYAPPEDLTPAEVGTLVDNSPDMRDIVATLVDLAVRGYLTIEEKEDPQLLGLWSRKDYVFVRKREQTEGGPLHPHEEMFLNSLFDHGRRESVELSQLQNKFYKNLPALRDRIYDRLVERRYYARRPDKVKTAYTIGGAGLGLVVAWGGTLISNALGMAPLAALIAGALTAAVVIAFGRVMPARTLQGTRTLEGVLGFEEFLERVEEERFERVIKTPELFEKYLPFAMALGVEKKWAAAFAEICRKPPDWYRSGDLQAFHAHSFVSSLGRMSNQAGSVMASAPRSSGGSGFGGGGRSGGGFGGGGGGGF